MPHHWRPIKEGAGGTARKQQVVQEVTAVGGTVLFVGSETGTSPTRWYALVDVTAVADPDAMWKNVGTKGSAKKLS